jgi:Protein of unknown function (DUF1360)
VTQSIVILLVSALAVYRLTRLIVEDTITAPIREIVRHAGYRLDGAPAPEPEAGIARFLHGLITCPWCVSPYVAGGAVTLQIFCPTVWWYAAVILAFSAVAGLLSER